MSAINRRRRTVSRETGSFWLSFSDMMSVLVLVFIFVIFSMMLSLVKQKEQLAKTEDQYAAAMQRMEASEKELSEKETILATTEAQLKDLTEELNGKTLILQQKEQELSDQAELIRSQQEEIDRTVIVLNDEKQALDEQLTAAETKLKALENSEKELEDNRVLIIDLRKQLSDSESENTRLSQRIEMLKSNAEASQQEIDELLKAIEDKKAELDKLGVDYQTLVSESENAKKALSDAESRIDSQSAQLTEYEQQLDAYRDELQKKQGQLEQMVGVKAQIVQQLSSALRKSGIDVSVDEQTGAIALPSQMLFTTNSATLSNGGRSICAASCRSIWMCCCPMNSGRMWPRSSSRGTPDSNGTYLHNLQLSQERALSVANYVLGDSFMSDTLGLNASAKKTLLGLVTASGRSFSAPVLGANGDEDQNASRRVEIKFRLKDDETIAATEELLKLMGAN